MNNKPIFFKNDLVWVKTMMTVQLNGRFGFENDLGLIVSEIDPVKSPLSNYKSYEVLVNGVVKTAVRHQLSPAKPKDEQ